MAKDGDIIEAMFGWFITLFTWIIGGILKIGVWTIVGLFGLLVAGIKGLWNLATKKNEVPLE